MSQPIELPELDAFNREIQEWATTLAKALYPPVKAIVNNLSQLVDTVNAKGGYFTDEGREVGWFEYQDYQKHKVQNEIAQLRAELVDKDAEF